jgi:Flp pilus assembly protein TadG
VPGRLPGAPWASWRPEWGEATGATTKGVVNASSKEKGSSERGAAVVELLVVFVTLLVPLVYVMLVMADVQRALLATSGAAREAGRLYVTGADRLDAERRARAGYREVLGTYGVGAGDPRAGIRLRAGCPPAAAGCVDGFGPGAEVQVVVTYRVPVARVPFLGAIAGPAVTIGATHHTRVDRYRGLGA